MIIGRVLATVVTPTQHPCFDGLKLLVVGSEDGRSEVLAVDTVGSGIGELVLVVLEGRSAGLAAGRERAPIDAAVVAIVDPTRATGLS